MQSNLSFLRTFFLLIFYVSIIFAQDVLWMWFSGNRHGNQPMTKNNPGSRSGSTIWKEDNTLIWLFGGYTYDTRTKHHEMTNDLWKYNITAGKWHQVHPGSKINYSTDNPHRAPPVRQLATSCGVHKEVFLVYGGFGKEGALSDTWLYEMTKGKWLPLSEMYKKNHDIAAKVSPSARGDVASWCLHDKLVIFGGEHHNQELYNDIWRFSLVDLQWSKAESTKKLPENKIGMSLIQYPKARSGATTWTSGADLYMFGGKVKSNIERRKNSKIGFSSDMWIYHVNNDRWNFLGGHDDPGHAGVYGMLGRSSKDNLPGCRRSAASLVDHHGDFWLFGGEGTDETSSSVSKHLSDLWYYEKLQKTWTWMGGSKVGNKGGKFKNQQENVIDGFPGARKGSISWGVGNWFFIYGGTGHDVDNKDGILSDLWRIDVHNKVEYKNSAYAGTIFMIVFTFLGLTSLAVVSFVYTRKYFRHTAGASNNPYDVEYAPLTASADT